MKQNLSQNKKLFSFLVAGEQQSLSITCPRCGGEVELWSAAEETRCRTCDHKLYQRESTVH